VLDLMTGAGGAVTDSQSGFRALNRKAIQLLAGTLRPGKDRSVRNWCCERYKMNECDCVIMAVVRDAFRVVKRWKRKV